MLINSFLFVDLDDNIVDNNPINNPYSFDPYVLWKQEGVTSETKFKGTAWSDRLREWNPEKYQVCKDEWLSGTENFGHQEPEAIENFLREYFLNETIKLQFVIKGCNVATGFPTYCFGWL